MPREYGSRMRTGPSTEDVLWYAGTAATVGYSLYTMRSSAYKYLEKSIAGDLIGIERTMWGVKNNQTAIDNISKILKSEKMGWREALGITVANSKLSRALEHGAEYIQPLKILDNILKLPELRYAAKTQFMELTGKEVLTKGVEGRLLYIRGNAYELTKDGALKKQIENVYLSQGAFASILKNMARTQSERPTTDTLIQKLRYNLDIAYGQSKANVHPLSFLTNLVEHQEEFKGLEPELIKKFDPVDIWKNIVSDVESQNYKRAFSRLSPGRSVSFFGDQIALPEESLKDITAVHMMPYHLLNRMNTEISKRKGLKWFALSDYSDRSFADIYLSIGLKRVLPVYATIEAYKYVNWKTQQLTGKDFEAHGGDVAAQAMLDIASIKDKTGITNVLKRSMQIAPEVVSNIAHPFVDQPVGLTRDELQQYFATGREGIRKGRWWLFGSGVPLKGEKTEYYAPNWYKRTQHEYKDYAYTDVRYGSKAEYFKYGTWLPTPDSPLAPLNRLLDPYHFENKNYDTRPYPVTGELFANNIFGWPLNQTIGRIIKPRRLMHKLEMSQAMRGLKTLNEKITDRLNEVRDDRLHFLYITPGGQSTAMEAIPPPGAPGSSPMGGYQSTIAEAASTGDLRQLNEETKRVQPGPYGKNIAKETLRQLNKLIAQKSDRQAYKTEGKSTYGDVLLNARYPKPEDVYGETPYEMKKMGLLRNAWFGFGKLFASWREVGGIYGFLTRSALDRNHMLNFTTGPVLESSKIGSMENTYRDLNIGGMDPWGGSLMEIARRFLPKRQFASQEINLITNRMPGWLPGEDYYMNFRRGDPYSKIAMGEIRMPGEAYEKLHGFNISQLPVRGSMIGKSSEEIFQYLLGMRGEPTFGEDRILKGGTAAHRKIQKQFQNQGILIEAERVIEDKEHHLTGHIDAIVRGAHGKEIVEIKTKKDAEALARLTSPEQSHIEQLMFYMHTTGIHKGYLQYATRDDPTNGPRKIFKINYDEAVFKHSLAKVEIARSNINKLLKSKIIAPGDLYSPMDRFRILADVAPYSKEYEYYKGSLSRELEEGSPERKEFSEIKRETTELKRKVRLSPYRFRDAAITTKTLLVQKVIAPGVIKFFGLKNPVRMAGIKVYNNEEEGGQVAKDFMASSFHFLAPIKIGIARDKSRQVENDVYGSIHAAMWNMTGLNLNKELMEQGGAVDKDTDYRPASVYARFSPSEIAAGKITEGLAHLNIPYIHNKLMPVNSAIEEYERQEIYGKRFTRWTHPVKDMIIPGIRTYASEGILSGTMYGAFLGAVLATPKKRAVVAAIGAGVGMLASIAMNIGGRDSHIPGNIRYRRRLDEYFDRLKYVKFRRLYEAARKEIKRTEHIDIEALLRQYELEGIEVKHRREYLMEQKRKDKAEGIDVKPINKKLSRIAMNRRRLALTPQDSRAIQFREQYKATMYGLDMFGAFANIYRALPKMEREYFNDFVEAPERERKRILRLVPKDVGRLLKAKWTGKQEDKVKPLGEYFKDKFLPNSDWLGWTQERALEDYKMVSMKNAGMDIQQEDYWPSDVARAEEQGITDIHPFAPSMFRLEISDRIKKMMHSAGFKDIEVKIHTTPSKNGHGIHVNGKIEKDRRKELEAILNDPDLLEERVKN